MSLSLLVLPDMSPERIVRALGHAPLEGPDLVAQITRVLQANAAILRFVLPDGSPAPLPLEPVAAALSVGGDALGLVELDETTGRRSWQTWTGGQRVQWLTQEDELYLPLDAEGRPDLDAEPRTQAQGVPEGWVLLRSCLDRGMERSFSCRFGPVQRALAEGGEGTTGWELRRHGHAVAHAWQVGVR